MFTELISRKDASEKGLKFYFTGRPCNKNHVSERSVLSTKCKSCAQEANKKNADERSNREKVLPGNPSGLEIESHLSKTFPDNDYSAFRDSDRFSKHVLKCSIHGEVESNYKWLISSEFGCPNCGRDNKTTKAFTPEHAISIISSLHPNQDFSKAVYLGLKEVIEFDCPKHGPQKREFHKVRYGKFACESCRKEDVGDRSRITLEDFIKNARNKYEDALLDDFSESVYVSNKDDIIIKCATHGYYEMAPSNYLGSSRCPKCYTRSGHSKGEVELLEYIVSLGVNVVHGKRLTTGHQIDIYLPDLDLGFEFDGIYYHGENCQATPLLEKTLLAKKEGIKVIHIYEDEWKFKKDIVKNKIKSMLGFTERVFARKCSIKSISSKDSEDFMNTYHIQGNSIASVRLALVINGINVAVMTFGKPRFYRSEGDCYELIRYCSKGTVVGGFSKLLKAFIREYNPSEIISYSDKRWSIGGVYLKNGFELSNTSSPGYNWCKNDSRYNRMEFQKYRLKSKFPDIYSDEKTEVQMCHEKGYWRIWDCGQDRWTLKLE